MRRIMMMILLAALVTIFQVSCQQEEPASTQTKDDAAATSQVAEAEEQVEQAVTKAEETVAEIVEEVQADPPPVPTETVPEVEVAETVPAMIPLQDHAATLVSIESAPDVEFADYAFPPTIPDTDWHRDAWEVNDCLRCHETGVNDATVVQHAGMPDILLAAKCRSCHVLIPGDTSVRDRDTGEEPFFNENAFPPMMPISENHLNAWTIKDCLLCHETGVGDAPKLVHKDLPRIYLKVKCRTCHVQVRSIESDS